MPLEKEFVKHLCKRGIDMSDDKYEKIVTLNNEVEARLLESLLRESNIPCFLKSYHDSMYDGLWQSQMGWGHVEAPSEYKEEILRLYKNMRNAK